MASAAAGTLALKAPFLEVVAAALGVAPTVPVEREDEAPGVVLACGAITWAIASDGKAVTTAPSGPHTAVGPIE